MLKLLKVIVPVLLLSGPIHSLFAQNCTHVCMPDIVWACMPSPGFPCFSGQIIGADKLNTFIGPFTPEQVGSALNLKLISSSLGSCTFLTITTFPVSEWDSNGPDTRLWSGHNKSGSMLDDDNGFQYNFSKRVEMPSNGADLDLSIDFYPNTNNQKAFYIFIVPHTGYCNQVEIPSGW